MAGLRNSLLFCCLIGVVLPTASLPAESAEGPQRWIERVRPLAQSVIKRRNIAGLQLAAFQRGEVYSEAFGRMDPEGQQPVTVESLFAGGELVRPLVAQYVLREAARTAGGADLEQIASLALQPDPGLPAFQGPGAERVSLRDLLTMSSGLPPSRGGLLYPASAAAERRPLEERLLLDAPPGERIAIAPEGYAWLSRWLAAKRGGAELQSLAAAAADAGDRRFCFDRNACQAAVASGLVFEGSRFFETPLPELRYPGAWGLYTSAADYARFLGRTAQRAAADPRSVEANQLRLRYSYHPLLGGMAAGFRFMRPAASLPADAAADPERERMLRSEEDIIYVAESRQPGYSALAFMTRSGEGAVVLANVDDPDGLREIIRYFWRRLGILSAMPDALTVPEQALELRGLYWPIDTLPADRRRFRFLNEIRVYNSRPGLEFASVFQKETATHLQWTGVRDLYIARGEASIEGWRALAERDASGAIVGIVTDLARYERRSPFVSAWAIIIVTGSIPVIPFFILLFYFLKRQRRPGEGA